MIAHFPKNPDSKTSSETNILLDANNFNRIESLRDVSAQLPVIFSQWEEQLALKLNDQLLKLPLKMQEIATASATNIYFSPDEKKMLYTAKNPIQIPEEIIPSLPATSTQPEQRQLAPGNIYIYDIEEDKNFLIAEKPKTAEENFRELLIDSITPNTLFSPESSPSAYTKLQKPDIKDTIAAFRSQYTPITIQPIQWFPDSKHLIFAQEDKIIILEYEGTNPSLVYSGKYEDYFTYPWPDGTKLLIITNLNSESEIPPNLYAINLE